MYILLEGEVAISEIAQDGSAQTVLIRKFQVHVIDSVTAFFSMLFCGGIGVAAHCYPIPLCCLCVLDYDWFVVILDHTHVRS